MRNTDVLVYLFENCEYKKVITLCEYAKSLTSFERSFLYSSKVMLSESSKEVIENIKLLKELQPNSIINCYLFACFLLKLKIQENIVSEKVLYTLFKPNDIEVTKNLSYCYSNYLLGDLNIYNHNFFNYLINKCRECLDTDVDKILDLALLEARSESEIEHVLGLKLKKAVLLLDPEYAIDIFKKYIKLSDKINNSILKHELLNFYNTYKNSLHLDIDAYYIKMLQS